MGNLLKMRLCRQEEKTASEAAAVDARSLPIRPGTDPLAAHLDYVRIADHPGAISRCRLRFQADSSDHISEPVIVSQRIKNRFHFETYEAGFPIAECFFQSLQRTLVVIQPDPND